MTRTNNLLDHACAHIPVAAWERTRAGIDALISSQRKIDIAVHNLKHLRNRKPVVLLSTITAAEAALETLLARHLQLMGDFSTAAHSIATCMEGDAP